VTKDLRRRTESALEAHGAFALRQAIHSVMQGNRDGLRALNLDDCYRLELRQMLEMIDGRQEVDYDGMLKEMLREGLNFD
jgi:hypothetical protein